MKTEARPNKVRPHTVRARSIGFHSIRARMTAGFALFSVGLMLLVCLAFYLVTKRAERRNADALLWQAAQEVRQEIADSEKESEPEKGGELENRLTPDFLMDIQTRRSSGLVTLVFNSRGRLIAHSPPPIPPWPLRGDSWRAQLVAGRRVSVLLALPWEKTERELRERAFYLLLLSVLVVAATAGGAWVLVGRTLSPIDDLAQQARTSSAENLRAQLEAPSADAEIVRLVETLNDLLARWSETARSRERFYAAAAHELRTPLQALGGHLEVALSRPREAGEYRAALEESRAQTERLTSLVQDLLLLNQLEGDASRAPAMRSAAVEFDLAELCENELRPLRALANERELRLEMQLPERYALVAPWNHATMLLRNLLENAVKYATHGGVVRVALAEQTLTVCNDFVWDDGVQTEQLFEPFFRPDASRTSATGGNGLGLAICRSICASNGWRIALHHQNGTLCATVDFAPQ